MTKTLKVAKTAPDALRNLWKEDFFKKEAKSQEEVEKKLDEEGYHFDDNALRMALIRAKFLLPKGKYGEKRFIQRHPYVEDKNGTNE